MGDSCPFPSNLDSWSGLFGGLPQVAGGRKGVVVRPTDSFTLAGPQRPAPPPSTVTLSAGARSHATNRETCSTVLVIGPTHGVPSWVESGW